MRTSNEITFGQLVGSYRTLRARISQDAFADLIGISKASFRKWEIDQSKPSAQNLQKLLEVLLDLGVFTASKEIEEARAFWRTSEVNVVFDEVWTNALVNTRHRSRPEKRAQVAAALPPDSESESATNSIGASLQKEKASSFPDIHLEGTMIDDQDSEGEGMNKGRRKTTYGIVLVGTTALTAPQAFIADVQRVLRQPSLGPSNQELEDLEQKIRDYWQARYNVTFAPVDQFLYAEIYVQEVKTLLNHSLLPSTRTRLCACLSQGMLLMGACFYDARQFQMARACYQIALEAAHEANNPILQAQAWYWDSYSWLFSNEPDRYQYALDSILKACHFASLASDLAVQGVTLAGSAEVYGYLKDKAACLEALKRVSTLGGYGRGDYYHIHQFDDTRSLNGYRGCCLQQFDQPSDPDSHALLEDARQAIKEGLSQLGTVSLQRTFYVADMAQLDARTGEVESACNHARQTIPFALTSAAVRHTLATVRTLLEPYADAGVVKDLDREIAMTLLGQR